MPAIASNGKFQTLALVQAAGGHVVVGNTSSASPVNDAFSAFRAYLGGAAGNDAAETSIDGVIDRFVVAGSRILFTVRGRRQVYTIADLADPNVLLARSGDAVRFTASQLQDGLSLVRDFHDRNLGG